MASSKYIPSEIIDQILGQVPRPDLLTLCFVNSAVKRSAERFLYSAVFLTWDYNAFPLIASFVASLVQRPELANHLDVVELEGTPRSRYRAGPEPVMDMSEIPIDELAAAIAKQMFPLLICGLRSSILTRLTFTPLLPSYSRISPKRPVSHHRLVLYRRATARGPSPPGKDTMDSSLDYMPFGQLVPLVRDLADARPARLPRLQRVVVVGSLRGEIEPAIGEQLAY